LCGATSHPPEALLKLYLYGYLNKVRSSRGLESETYRNLEVIWLVEELRPSYKTIADFRKNNNKTYDRYKSKVSACKQCPVRSQCLTDKATSKQLMRWEHEAVTERHQTRMHNSKGIMRQRGALVEHPFGTLWRVITRRSLLRQSSTE